MVIVTYIFFQYMMHVSDFYCVRLLWTFWEIPFLVISMREYDTEQAVYFLSKLLQDVIPWSHWAIELRLPRLRPIAEVAEVARL